jgi:hypothetical protein
MKRHALATLATTALLAVSGLVAPASGMAASRAHHRASSHRLHHRTHSHRTHSLRHRRFRMTVRAHIALM